MFELLQATKAKMINVVVLSQKNRQPDEDPGAKLSIEAQLPAAMLSHFAAKLPAVLFEGAPDGGPAQGTLEGVQPASETPNLTEIGLKVGKLIWTHEMTGYTLTIYLGLRRADSNLTIKDSILSNWRLMPKEGGTVIARFDLESADVSPEAFGKLAKLKSREIEMSLHPPVVAQGSLEMEADDGIPPAPARKPGAAERAAVAKVKKGEPAPKVPHKGDEKPARTKRGKEQTKAALEAGAKGAAGAAGGVTPEGAWPFPKGKGGSGEAPPQSVTTEKKRRGDEPTGHEAGDAFAAAHGEQ